jgi:hypothetical protein
LEPYKVWFSWIWLLKAVYNNSTNSEVWKLIV